MHVSRLSSLLVTAALAGCGGSDDGAPASIDAGAADATTADARPALTVPDPTYLDELTDPLELELCTWMVEIQGGPHTVDCGGGTQVTIDPVEACLENPWPHCQVGLLRACVEAQAVDLCADAPPACATFYECVAGG